MMILAGIPRPRPHSLAQSAVMVHPYWTACREPRECPGERPESAHRDFNTLTLNDPEIALPGFASPPAPLIRRGYRQDYPRTPLWLHTGGVTQPRRWKSNDSQKGPG